MSKTSKRCNNKIVSESSLAYEMAEGGRSQVNVISNSIENNASNDELITFEIFMSVK